MKNIMILIFFLVVSNAFSNTCKESYKDYLGSLRYLVSKYKTRDFKAVSDVKGAFLLKHSSIKNVCLKTENDNISNDIIFGETFVIPLTTKWSTILKKYDYQVAQIKSIQAPTTEDKKIKVNVDKLMSFALLDEKEDLKDYNPFTDLIRKDSLYNVDFYSLIPFYEKEKRLTDSKFKENSKDFFSIEDFVGKNKQIIRGDALRYLEQDVLIIDVNKE